MSIEVLFDYEPSISDVMILQQIDSATKALDDIPPEDLLETMIPGFEDAYTGLLAFSHRLNKKIFLMEQMLSQKRILQSLTLHGRPR